MVGENSFGEMLRKFRVRQGPGWTQEYTAEQLEVSTRTYIDWEMGKRIPLPKHRPRIATLFRLKQEEADALYRAAGQMPPEICHLPFPQNPLFTGRRVKLEQLDQLLKENSSQPVCICGLGGVGKTQLALEYAHRNYPDRYRTVLWGYADDEETLQRSYLSLANLLKLPEHTESNPDLYIQAVKLWLGGHSGWLLILDNVDNLELIRSFLPVTYRDGRILLTSRSQAVGNSARRIVLEEMEPEEGLRFLLQRIGVLQNETKLDAVDTDVRHAASELAVLLGRLPLALDQAGAYIEETGVSLTDYLQLYREKRRLLLNRRGNAYGEHKETIVATVELSVERACERQPLAGDLLRFYSFLQPDTIPEELLCYADGFKLDTTALNEVIAALQRYSLITRNPHEKLLSMHRLVQAVLVDAMPPDLTEHWQKSVIRALQAAFPHPNPKTWKQCERLVPHVLVCLPWMDADHFATLDYVQLFRKAGYYFRERGPYAVAEALLKRAVSIYEQQLGADHPDTGWALSLLAGLHIAERKSELAEALYQRILLIFERRFGPKSLEVALMLTNLATANLHQDKYEQAALLYSRAAKVYEACADLIIAPHDISNFATTMINLALIESREGRHDEATQILEVCIQFCKKQLGNEHPTTALAFSHFAEVYQRQEKLEQAVSLCEQALAIYERNFGAKHPQTAQSMHMLATLFHQQGNYERAETLYRMAIDIQIELVGTTHKHTLETIKDYSSLLRTLGLEAEVTTIKTMQEEG